MGDLGRRARASTHYTEIAPLRNSLFASFTFTHAGFPEATAFFAASSAGEAPFDVLSIFAALEVFGF